MCIDCIPIRANLFRSWSSIFWIRIPMHSNKMFFHPGDIVLDPFCGTTLVQASELGLHAIGLEVSAFNAFIANVKIGAYNVAAVKKTAAQITAGLRQFQCQNNHSEFEKELSAVLKKFNQEFFPSPAYKYTVRQNTIFERKLRCIFSRQRQIQPIPKNRREIRHENRQPIPSPSTKPRRKRSLDLCRSHIPYASVMTAMA